MLILAMLNKWSCYAHTKFSANQITWSRFLRQIHILNDKQCRSRTDLDLQCLQKWCIFGFSRTVVSIEFESRIFKEWKLQVCMLSGVSLYKIRKYYLAILQESTGKTVVLHPHPSPPPPPPPSPPPSHLRVAIVTVLKCEFLLNKM